MTLLRLRPRTQAAGVVAIAAALALSACSSSKSTAGSSPSSAAPPAATTAAASAAPSTAASAAPSTAASAAASSPAGSAAADPASLVPASIKTAGVLNIATDASYAPNEYFDTDGKTIIGLDVDLGNAIAAKLGLKANFQNVTFDAIIPALAAGKYDLSLSSFTDTKAREATVDFVDYFNAGESLMVLAGNPKGVTGPDLSLCGLTIAVEKGTTEESEIPALSTKCTAAGKKAITGLSSDDQNGANLALTSGRADVGSADSPIAAYAVKQLAGKIQLAGQIYETAPYGIAIPKSPGLAPAVQAAVASMIADGSYKTILDKWGDDAGAITTAGINGATS
ncbi:MAG TPA: ABC transporter substrate-binding protein [Acidothermaceae bacterium]